MKLNSGIRTWNKWPQVIIKGISANRLHIQLSWLPLLFFLIPGCYPANVKAQAKIILTDDHTSQWIGKSIYYLKDPKGKLSLEQVLSPEYDSLFVRCKQDAPNFGNVQMTVWNKFTVVNRSSKKFVLSELNYNIDTLTFYYKNPTGKYEQIVLGSSRPISARKYKSNLYTFDLPLALNETQTYYLKVQTYLFQYPLVINTYERFVEDIYKYDISKGFYYGFVLLIAIYNLTLYITLKDRDYLYYLFYIFFTSIIMAEHSGINAFLLGDNLHFLWNRAPAALAISNICFVVFSRSFLQIKKYSPFVNRLINYCFIPGALLIVVFNLINKNLYASVLNQVLGLIVLVSMTATAIYIYNKGFRTARFYILACSFYFAGAIIFIMKTSGLLPYNLFTTNAMEIGSAIEMMMFSVSMSDRINIFKKERARAQKELVKSLQENEKLILGQNKMLEAKVEERTSALSITLRDLKVSQAELEEKNKIILHEKERSDKLLLNILPFETAQELKENGAAKAQTFDNVTIMFTDFKDFSTLSEKMLPGELVTELNDCFKAFDQIMDVYNIEKIKTIGDSYMAVGGLPIPNDTNAHDVVLAALEIRMFMHNHNRQRIKESKEPFEIRIGIHTGPVVAGIIGLKKFAYDVWGDSVNTASRMESCGTAGKINISGSTYQLIRNSFACSYRGKVEAKNKGMVDMYFVEGHLI